MGWWSEDIFGGDEPLDALSELGRDVLDREIGVPGAIDDATCALLRDRSGDIQDWAMAKFVQPGRQARIAFFYAVLSRLLGLEPAAAHLDLARDFLAGLHPVGDDPADTSLTIRRAHAIRDARSLLTLGPATVLLTIPETIWEIGGFAALAGEEFPEAFDFAQCGSAIQLAAFVAGLRARRAFFTGRVATRMPQIIEPMLSFREDNCWHVHVSACVLLNAGASLRTDFVDVLALAVVLDLHPSVAMANDDGVSPRAGIRREIMGDLLYRARFPQSDAKPGSAPVDAANTGRRPAGHASLGATTGSAHANS